MIRAMETFSRCSAGPVVLIHEHVTGGGVDDEVIPASWLVEGTAMRRALAHDFASAGTRVWMTLDTRMPAEPGPWTIERIAPGQACERLREIGRRADLTIPIAPETGGALRDLAECISDSGGRSLGSTRDAIDLTADKVRLCAHLAGIGVPTPASIRVVLREGLPRDVSYPAILKPIDGAGCADTLLLGTADDPLVSSYPRDSGLLQPLVHGEPRSATFLAQPGRQAVLLCVARQFIDIVGGRLAYRGGKILTEDLPPDHSARAAIRSIPGLAGLVGVDYVVDPASRASVVIEINPRPTTSCVGLIAGLGPGRLARYWLESIWGGSRSSSGAPELPTHSIDFRADGWTSGTESSVPHETPGPWA